MQIVRRVHKFFLHCGKVVFTMTSTAELRARDTATAHKLDETTDEQKKLLDQHIDVQVTYSPLVPAVIQFLTTLSRSAID